MAIPDENTQGAMQDQGQTQPQPPQSNPNQTEIGKGATVENARANAMAMMQQQEEMVQHLNAYIQAMQNPQLGMQQESAELQQKLAALDAENDKQVNALNQKAAAIQKKKGVTSLAVSVAAAAAVGALAWLGVKKRINNPVGKWSMIGGATLGAGVAGGTLAAKLFSGDKNNYQLANEMMTSIASTNDKLMELTTTYGQAIQQKLSRITANPGAAQPTPASQQPPEAVNPDILAAQTPAPASAAPAADVPPLARVTNPKAEQALPQVAAGVGGR